MKTLRIIFGDQLSESIATLNSLDKDNDTIMICEVIEEATYVSHHPKKIAFLFSAMRHFAKSLEDNGIHVRYIKLDDPKNTGNFSGEVARAIHELSPSNIILTEPGEYRVLSIVQSWQNKFAIHVEILKDSRFLATQDEFSRWAYAKKQLRMEFFYREMRKKHKILIDSNNNPSGGEWNYDKENRNPPKSGIKFPRRISHKKSFITKEVLQLVKTRFSNNFGNLEPFYFAVTREEALIELKHFITEILPNFGEYQDAMVSGEPYMYHSLISSYLNCGLLLPLEVCKKAEEEYLKGNAPLNAVEGFIRQILGWREYIRGIYWLFMPNYAKHNYLNATRTLPEFYWTAKTQMSCMKEAISHTQEHAYSHHIQRLMITGNFALIAGLDVIQVQNWYLAVYSDAYEWVEMPNTLGMSLFGDNGIVASKPYAASGKYINRMSNYCKDCKYNPNKIIEDDACPFNSLYWDFLARNADKLSRNPRMKIIYSSWYKFSPDKQKSIRDRAKIILEKIENDKL